MKTGRRTLLGMDSSVAELNWMSPSSYIRHQWPQVRILLHPRKQIVMSMETIAYTIIAAIVLAMGWIVWAVVKEGRPELPGKEDEK